MWHRPNVPVGHAHNVRFCAMQRRVHPARYRLISGDRVGGWAWWVCGAALKRSGSRVVERFT